AGAAAVTSLVCGTRRLFGVHRPYLPVDRRWSFGPVATASPPLSLLLPLIQDGRREVFAGVAGPEGQALQLWWREEDAWLARPALRIAGPRQFGTLAATTAPDGSPRLITVVRPTGTSTRWESWLVDFAP
ncbi:MAG: hypothetical protein ACK4N5_23750, partial [Myxococcales bacterium]